MVFQSYAVFPHMKVSGNIAFGLRMRKADQELIDERVRSTAELLHIEDLLDRYPAQLSGGQRQRIAVARAARHRRGRPAHGRAALQPRRSAAARGTGGTEAVHHELRTTTIYVTHDQIEAMSMGDRIAVMNGGRIEQLDIPLQVYDEPVNTFVGGFIGSPPMNFVDATVSTDDGDAVARMSGGDIRLPRTVADEIEGRELVLGIRAENVTVQKEEDPGLVRARVVVCELLGSHNLLTVEVGDDVLKVAADPALFPPADSDIWLGFEPEHIKWMDRETGERIDV